MTRNPPKSTQAKSGTSAPKKGKADDDVKKTRAKPVEWNEHPEWTNKAIAYLIQFPAFRIKLFSDSTSDANKDGRRKLTAKDPKNQLYAELAKAVFENNEDEEIRNEYTQDMQRFGRSTQLHFGRLKKTYQEHVRTIKETGSGVEKSEEDRENIIAHIRTIWPFWDDLNAIWHELPNYKPVGVTSSKAGQDFAAGAERLFQPGAKSGGKSEEGSGIGDGSELEAEKCNNTVEGGGDEGSDDEEVIEISDVRTVP
ncbi:hypothetical protein JAAARDRAFT_144090 [Jaapia argillacea MUCL 33604]|uniref:Uncharacterized protein n=1 Tax=Jaapia argillacea MUCL 33604 TaxID=933084 RepID=A0A067P595_9AGAM|nr:hypothetical protein JAAARDRAFT_144090 [Jaapia argillacea MUCL 33604]